jgi:hypothetical protein
MASTGKPKNRNHQGVLMRLRPPTFVAVSLVAVVLGGGAYAAASSIDTQPAPKVVVPSSPSPQVQSTPAADDKGGLRSPGVSDDPANHDATDDKGGLRSPGVSDDPASHDATDDKGGLRSPGATDDPASHDATDDKGGKSGHDGSDDSTSSSGHGGSGH